VIGVAEAASAVLAAVVMPAAAEQEAVGKSIWTIN
jgi:hypothetical protein